MAVLCHRGSVPRGLVALTRCLRCITRRSVPFRMSGTVASLGSTIPAFRLAVSVVSVTVALRRFVVARLTISVTLVA
jgi:hypothetical protein